MYPTISDFLYDVFGVNIPLPIQTYGFFVALAYLAGAWIMSLELKRKEKENKFSAIEKRILVGEPAKPSAILISAVIGFILGFKLLDAVLRYDEFVANPQSFLLSAQGSFLGGFIGAALSGVYTWWEKHRQRKEKPEWVTKQVHPYELTGNILVVAAIFGLLGAKIFHNLENFDQLLEDPAKALFSFSGLTFYGGLIVGGAALLIYANKNGVKPLHTLDAGAPTMALAYGIGRIGCQTSGDGCWGVPNPNPKPDWLSWLPDWAWAYDYPHNVINEGVKMTECAGNHCYVLDTPVYPTPLWEATLGILMFAILWSVRKKITIPGILFSIYLIMAGTERFFIEKIRINNVYQIFGAEITQAEIISFIQVAAGIIGILYFYKNRKTLKNY